jgi:membrane fusion protein
MGALESGAVESLKLFRAEALEARGAKWYGEILIAQSPSARVVVAIAAVAALLLTFYLYAGTYTRRVTVVGQLVPVGGLVKIYSPQTGVVVTSRVEEGQRVRKGEVLFVVSSEKQTSRGESQAAISQQAQLQKQLLLQQVQRVRLLQQAEESSTRKEIERLQTELPQLERQAANQRSRVELVQHSLDRYQQLQAQGYVTTDQILQKQAEVLDQKTLFERVDRERLASAYSLTDARSKLSTLPLKYGNQIADLQRALAGIEQSIVESDVQRQLAVAATEDGVVTALAIHSGQWVDSSTPLASLSSGEEGLLAELYAPSKAVGLLKPGDEVHIRYPAFPYQKFGQFRGHVVQIASSALTSAELTRTNVFESNANARGEPLYRVSVALGSQSVTALGRAAPLRAGMLLDADVRLDTRPLYEWLLEPLQSIGQKL